jgi:hypothetical protein
MVALGAVLSLSYAQSQPRVPLLAVLPLQSRGLDTNSLRILEDGLAQALLQGGKVRLLERAQMSNILKEQGFQKSGACDQNDCAVEVGKLLGVERGVAGSVGLLGKSYVLNLRMVDIASGEILSASQRTSSGEIEKVLTETMPLSAADLLEDRKDRNVKSGRGWMLWTAGGVAVAGGVTAAILLSGGKGKDAPVATTTTGTGTTKTPGLGGLDVSW